jgi:hypothetical protein
MHLISPHLIWKARHTPFGFAEGTTWREAYSVPEHSQDFRPYLVM